MSATSGLWSAGGAREYHQVDVYIYQCVFYASYVIVMTWEK